MDYLAAKDEGADDEVKAVATHISDPEEDSRTATFSSKGSKRASPEPASAQNQDVMEVDGPDRPVKRQKLERKARKDQTYTRKASEPPEPPTLATTRSRREAIVNPKKYSKSGNIKIVQQSGPLPEASSRNQGRRISPQVVIEAPMAAPPPSGNVRTSVRITNMAKKATLEEFEVFLADFDHEPLTAFAGSRKKNKEDLSLVVNFPSHTEAQRAITKLNGSKVRSREVFLNYTGVEAQVAQPSPPSKPAKTPQTPQAIEILSDEEGEIDESAPAESSVIPETGSAKEIHEAELINGAARQTAARLTKGKFKVEQTQQNFHEGVALLLSVAWPVVPGNGAAKQKVTREMLRKRLYGIIPFARFNAIRVCFQPATPKPKDAEKCIVIYRSPEAATAAKQYLTTKQFTEQDMNFTIKVDTNADIKDTPAGKLPPWRVVPKGVDRESLAIGVAGAARKEIAQGMYTTKRFLSFGSNPKTPLFEERAGATNIPSTPEDVDVGTSVATRSMISQVNNDASENSLSTTTQNTTQNTPTMGTSSSLTNLPKPDRYYMYELNEHERALQTRYNFIERDDDIVFCAFCNARGHMSETCPERTCKHCGADDHFDQFCPKNMKCGKCRERGHIETECTSKLKRTTADGFDCDICGRDGHPEEECPDHFVLMFQPPATPNKVDSVRVCCYVCASQQHYGDDCPDRMVTGRNERSRAPLSDSMHVFSAAFANKFLNNPLPPAVRNAGGAAAYPTSSGRPPSGSARGRGSRYTNGRDMSNAIDLEMVQDSLDSLPSRAPPRSNIPPPPREAQPPLPPGPPPPSLSRRHGAPPPTRYEQRNQNYNRGSDGYVQYQAPSNQYNNYPPPGSYQQPPRRRSRSPERRRGGGYMPPNRDYRDRNDGPQQQPMFPRGNNSLRGPPPQGPPGAPSMGRYGVSR